MSFSKSLLRQNKALVFPKRCAKCPDRFNCMKEGTLGVKCIVKDMIKLVEKGISLVVEKERKETVILSPTRSISLSQIKGFERTVDYFNKQHRKGYIITSHNKRYRNTTLDNFPRWEK